jgi:hypothetical protein
VWTGSIHPWTWSGTSVHRSAVDRPVTHGQGLTREVLTGDEGEYRGSGFQWSGD